MFFFRLRLSLCLFVCLSVCSHILKPRRPSFTQFSVHVTFGRGSVFLCRQCDTLCTSGFVDAVTFTHSSENRQNQRRRICFVEFSPGGAVSDCILLPTPA